MRNTVPTVRPNVMPKQQLDPTKACPRWRSPFFLRARASCTEILLASGVRQVGTLIGQWLLSTAFLTVLRLGFDSGPHCGVGSHGSQQATRRPMQMQDTTRHRPGPARNGQLKAEKGVQGIQTLSDDGKQQLPCLLTGI